MTEKQIIDSIILQTIRSAKNLVEALKDESSKDKAIDPDEFKIVREILGRWEVSKIFEMEQEHHESEVA